MLKKDLLEKIKSAKDDEDVNSLLAGTDIEETFKGEAPTLDVFKQKVKSDKAFQQFMDSERDTYHSKAVKTMKEKGSWESEFADVLTQKYPDLITDPTQKKLQELEKQLANEKASNARKDLLGEAMKYAKDKKLPSSVIEKCLGEDFEKTKEVIDSLSEEWSKGLETMVERLAGNKYFGYIHLLKSERSPVAALADLLD